MSQRLKILIWAAVAVLVTVACTFVIARQVLPQAAPALTTQEKDTLMEMADMLDSRLYQSANAVAEVQATAGTGATASVNGNDAVGQINIQTGANPAPGPLVHVKFISPYKTQPFVIIAPMDQPPPDGWYTTVDTNGFDIWVSAAPKAHTNYPFSYFVAPRPWLMYLGAQQATP